MGGFVPEMYKGAVAMGIKKANTPLLRMLPLTLLAGAQIGFGAFLALAAGGDTAELKSKNPGLTRLLTGIYGYPFGLFMVVIMGSDLFTSDVATVSLAFFEGKIKFRQLCRSWVVSWIGNFIGALMLAALVYDADAAPANVIISAARYKTSHSFHESFSRGVLCNWLVCSAIFMSTAADTLCGKFVAVLGPIAMFVSLGFDHSIANMFILSLALMLGADMPVGRIFVKNLIPVTLGNIIGGLTFVSFLSYAAYGEYNDAAVTGLHSTDHVPHVALPHVHRDNHSDCASANGYHVHEKQSSKEVPVATA